MNNRIITNHGISIDLDAITPDDAGVQKIKKYAEQVLAKRKEEAFDKVKSMLASSRSINRAMLSMEPFREANDNHAALSKVKPTNDLGFLLSDDYIPSHYLVTNAPRILTDLHNAYGEELCNQYGFTDATIYAANRANSAHRQAVILQSVVFCLEADYMQYADLQIQLCIQQVFAEDNLLCRKAMDALRSCQSPVTKDQVLKDRLGELVPLAQKAIDWHQNVRKALKYTALALAIVLGAALLAFASVATLGLLAVPFAIAISAFVVGGAAVGLSTAGLSYNVVTDERRAKADANLDTPVVANKQKTSTAPTGTPSDPGFFSGRPKDASDGVVPTRGNGLR